ncbi:MAG: DUF6807 family protein [Thermoguttaceae bacterium]
MKNFSLSLVLLTLCISASSAAEMVKDADLIKMDGKAVYHSKTSDVPFKPYVDVLCTPEGRNVLRDAPHDHLHHHALMFAVKADGLDFWGEFDENYGKQVVVGCSQSVTSSAARVFQNGIQSDDKETSISENLIINWNDAKGKTILKEDREIDVKCDSTKDYTLLTWVSDLKVADSEKPVELSGDHYFGLGLRFNQTMDKDGKFFTNEGDKLGELIRGDEFLTKCKWIAYTAKLDGKPVTVAVFDSPKNARPMLAFTMGQDGKSFAYIAATINLFREKYELTKDKPLKLKYGVAVWEGERTADEVNTAYESWK